MRVGVAREPAPDLGGLAEDPLGSDWWVFVGLAMAVQGAPERGFCFYVTHEVRSAIESVWGRGGGGALGSRGWRRVMERSI